MKLPRGSALTVAAFTRSGRQADGLLLRFDEVHAPVEHPQAPGMRCGPGDSLLRRRGAQPSADQGSPLFERSEFGRDPAEGEHRREARRAGAAGRLAHTAYRARAPNVDDQTYTQHPTSNVERQLNAAYGLPDTTAGRSADTCCA